MDIHKPKAAHSLREFLVEIGTITVGILIALGLEAAAEAHHNRELVDRTRADLREELRQDRSDLARTLAREKAAGAPFRAMIEYTRARLRGRPAGTAPKLQLELSLPQLGTTAWESTTATQALTHMPFDETRALTRAYARTRVLNQYQAEAVRRLIELNALPDDPDSWSPEELRTARREFTVSGGYLEVLVRAGEQVLQDYDRALKALQ